MGCDIHTFLEMKKTINGTEVWVNIDPHIYCGYEDKLEHQSIANVRDYELFAVLAGVRNREEVKPILEPRGVPDNCHKITLDNYISWDSDAHTSSWLTIKELKDYQATASKEVKRSGLLNPEQYERFSNGLEPESWCQGTNQPDYKHAKWTDRVCRRRFRFRCR